MNRHRVWSSLVVVALFVELMCLGLLCALAVGQTTADVQKAPRVVGTAQSNKEFEAYQNILSLKQPGAITRSAEDFLQTYPNSGLSPFIHQAAALAYQQLKDRTRVIRHGEAVLQDLPDNVVVLAILARTFAETDQPALSIARGTAALEAVGRMAPPSTVTESAWLAERANLETDLRLSLGTAYLTQAVKDQPPKREDSLRHAIENLQKSHDGDPTSGPANYRLGLAHLMKGDSDKALKFLAWTVALDGALSAVARARLEQVISSQSRLKAIDELVQKAKEDLQKAIQAKQTPRLVP